MRTDYARTYRQLAALWSTCRNEEAGKPLNTSGYYRFKANGENFDVFYGGWGDGGKLAPAAKIETFCPDDRIILAMPIGYGAGEDYYVNYQIKHINRCGRLGYARFKKNYDTPGWWLEYDPLFTGFTYRTASRYGQEVLTPAVPSIEEHMKGVQLEAQQKVKALIKPLRLYDKFQAFSEREAELKEKDWKERVEISKNADFNALSIDNAESIISFISSRANFGQYPQVTEMWRRDYAGFNYQKTIPVLLRYGAYKHIANIRNKLYCEWYNKG